MKSLRDYFEEVFAAYEGSGSFQELRQKLDEIFEQKCVGDFKEGEKVYLDAVATVIEVCQSCISRDGKMYKVMIKDKDGFAIFQGWTTAQFICPTDLPSSVSEMDRCME